jgi:hypothetical protein
VGSETTSFESHYPNITRWVNEEGLIEFGSDEFNTSFVRAIYEGGLVWEGEERYISVGDALRALDAAIAEWFAYE